ncbi:ICP0-binding domain of ubiquitin-specific protease 7-domain-containing protein, partial [Mycena sanguinolenta]
FITDDTFTVHNGFDLAVLDEKDGCPASNLPTFTIPRQQPYNTFKTRTAKHFGYPEDRIRLWVLVQRYNKTVRAGSLITGNAGEQSMFFPHFFLDPELLFSLALDHIKKNMCSSRKDLPLYLEILSESQSGRPPDSKMIFLKHFDPDKQTLGGVGRVHIKTEQVCDLVAVINERMRWVPNTLLRLYQARQHPSFYCSMFTSPPRKSNHARSRS